MIFGCIIEIQLSDNKSVNFPFCFATRQVWVWLHVLYQDEVSTRKSTCPMSKWLPVIKKKKKCSNWSMKANERKPRDPRLTIKQPSLHKFSYPRSNNGKSSRVLCWTNDSISAPLSLLASFYHSVPAFFCTHMANKTPGQNKRQKTSFAKGREMGNGP